MPKKLLDNEKNESKQISAKPTNKDNLELKPNTEFAASRLSGFAASRLSELAAAAEQTDIRNTKPTKNNLAFGPNTGLAASRLSEFAASCLSEFADSAEETEMSRSFIESANMLHALRMGNSDRQKLTSDSIAAAPAIMRNTSRMSHERFNLLLGSHRNFSDQKQ